MKNFSIYFTKIFKEWIIYLGFIPALYDLLNTYLKFNYQFPKYIIIGFPVVAFIYASYQIYLKEYLLRKTLEKKLDGPTNYEVKAILTPIDFQEEKLTKIVDTTKVDAQKRLETIPSQMARSYDLNIQNILSSFETNKTIEQYNRELKDYEKNLVEIINNTENCKKEIMEHVKEYKEKFYKIKFFIKNIGVISDSEIKIEIRCCNDNKVFEENDIFNYDMNLYSLIPNLPKEPEKPKKIINDLINSTSLNASFNSFMTQRDLHSILPQITVPNAFRKGLEITEKYCFAALRNLHVGDEADIFDKNLILLKEGEIKFEVTVKSKESKKVLHPKVIVEFGSEKALLFNYKEN
ncbi:hypothetical protein [Hydrogenimonas cancrithermarum]|uniref:Uncharacterized protein n=1 Tax=Hydrogenimonas cancrithermarum TaxID=2993563 RepID=A0ABM8FJL6_9BACT|nr:hypothetical protein [Hydrogenimonas cancrithermarum]BDY12475.1 hypothetical protein HCR_07870 [Hydrogenimonas cancrithermarum]